MQTSSAFASSIQKRNPVVMLAIGWGIPFVAGGVIGTILGSMTGIGIFSPLLWIAGSVVAGHFLKKMVEELKALTGDQSVNPTMMYVPFYNQVVCFLSVADLAERARQSKSVRTAAKPKWMYFLLPWYAIAADLNDCAA